MIGYGSQGRTHALNLRDSGVTDIVVGLKPGSKTRAVAEADGFKVMTAGEAAAGADVVAVMTSDEAHRDLWRDELAPTVRPGAPWSSPTACRCGSAWWSPAPTWT